MRPAVDALARHHRVITFSLCDERTSPFPCDPERAFENYVEQVELALDRAGLDRAVIAGVSYGGLIATEFAARRPERVSRAGARVGAAHVVATGSRASSVISSAAADEPVFVATAPRRMRPEMVAALPTIGERLRFSARQGARAVARAGVAGADGAADRVGAVASLCRSASREGAGADRHRRAGARSRRAGRCDAALSRRSAIGASTWC